MGPEEMETAIRVGEVVEASSSELVAQCYQLHEPPPLGSLVKTKNKPGEIYAIVYSAATHSLEPGRHPIARGEGEKEEAEIFQNNPQLAKLLCTDFKALVVGYSEEDKFYHYLPPKPACIHSFVYLCSLDEAKNFSQSLDFLSLLVEANLTVPADEIIAASLRYFGKAHSDRQKFLVKAGKELAILLSGELNRLNSILRRIR